ncbi:MAG: hypothetical protein QXG35_08330 [Nitrososphaerota archaeon]
MIVDYILFREFALILQARKEKFKLNTKGSLRKIALNIKVRNNTIFAEFSLSQPKRSWKIRSKSKRDERGKYDTEKNVWKFTPTMNDEIQEGDVFEWMVDNQEIRDILSALKCISKDSYEKIKQEVHNIRDEEYLFDNSHASSEKAKEIELDFDVRIEISLKPKQRKRKEKTPYLFVLFPLDRPTNICYIIDKRGEKIENPIGHKIMAGDTLVWIVREELIKEIVVNLAKLDKAHKNGLIKEVFSKIG